ncbi:SubName: Full=Uncharacterized protein {ECO:0000313/EMBL:CCA67201.1} [Serendipita indica DSM 11827]|uniref:C2H2-type domain-containing protein n=1 Tax=Serendipita indica (strain DSM 11827) TaxID=1109443 RepID=G4T751_SERID|nr:SubName: Full=Uncharacterized protein {ECO:0000313/EMBL:CCA67201.1} [Serendipita indica DSM 11827]CCA67201.1 hypothetical protein PIIN_01033 [Serendipita indica DSM 11827]
MKRPATEDAESTPPRTRRRVAPDSNPKLSYSPSPTPHAVRDESRKLSNGPISLPTSLLLENGRLFVPDSGINPLKRTTHTTNPVSTTASVRVALDNEAQYVLNQGSDTPMEDPERPNSAPVPAPPARRPLPRLKIKPLREPTPSSEDEKHDSVPGTPTKNSNPPPPASPSYDDDETEERELHSVVIVKPSRDNQNMLSVDLSKLPPSPTAVADLQEPEHRMPTPPFFVQNFHDQSNTPFEPDRSAIAESEPNANTYIRKAKFQRVKKGKKPSNNIWVFSAKDGYPRGETPPLDMMLDDVVGPIDPVALGLVMPPVLEKNDSDDFSDEEEAEVARDPGLPVTLAVGLDAKGRFVCKWGGCDKTFARNDHLGRHVKVTHLRVRKHRCEPCGLAFIGIKGLRTHEKTHDPSKMKAITSTAPNPTVDDGKNTREGSEPASDSHFDSLDDETSLRTPELPVDLPLDPEEEEPELEDD